MNDPVVIPIDEELKKFYNHIDYQERTILSAQFGDGKSYFLNKFKDTYKDDFLFLTIYPVNYQVAENRDIFEYIKRDILFQLSKAGLITDQIDFNGLVKSTFNKDSILELVDFLTSLINIAVPGSKVIAGLVKKIIKAKDAYDENKKTLDTFFRNFEDQAGLYEYDCYSKLITECIKNFKLKAPKKKVVLIVEDLDRIDPGHLFRILNIFSAHIDRPYISSEIENRNQNKFGIDKIITVCCYENIENIFHHLYGPNTNFEGYINKFTSYLPYDYSLNEIASQLIIEEIEKIIKFEIEENKDWNTFINKILDVSLRDKSKILEDMDRQIFDIPIKNDNDLSLSTKTPFIYLFVIFKRLGLPTSEYALVLKNICRSNPKCFVDLIGDIWFDEEIKKLNRKVYIDHKYNEENSIRIPLLDGSPEGYALYQITITNNSYNITSTSRVVRDRLNNEYIESIIKIAEKYIK